MVTQRVSLPRLDRAVDALVSGGAARPIDRAHLERFFPPQHAAGQRPSEVLAPRGLDRELEDFLMPRLSDPTILLRGRFMSLLTSLTRELDRDPVKIENDPVARLALLVLRQEHRRCSELHARLAELLEA